MYIQIIKKILLFSSLLQLLEDIPDYLQSQLPKAEDIELHIKEIEE